MAQWLKQSTATILKLGPFLDDTDGKTAETGLTIAQADIQISKAGAAFAQTSAAAPTTTHDADGWYPVPLTAADTGTLGRTEVQVAVAGALPVWGSYMVVPANVYDSLVAGSDTLEADLIQMGGVAQSATDLKDFADAGYDPATNKVQGVMLVDTTTANTDMVAEAPSAVANRQEMDANSSQLVAIIGDTNELQADWVNGGRLDLLLDAIKAVTDALPDGGALSDLAAILMDTGTTIPGLIAALNNLSQAQAQAGADAALVANHLDHLLKTDYDPAVKPGVATALLNEIVESDAGVSRFTTNALEQARGTNSAATAANLTTHDGKLDTLDIVADAIKLVTDALPNAGALTTIGTDTARLTAVRAAVLTDWIDGGRLDLLLDAIKAVTDALPNAGALSDLATILTDTGASIPNLINALNDPTAATIVAAIFAKTGITAAGLVTFAEMTNDIFAHARGQIDVSGDDFSYKDDDNVTERFKLTETAARRETI